MKPTLSYKDFLIESNCSECMSESVKEKMKEMCENHILREAMEYHDDHDPEHTYEGYVKECISYMNEILGSAGYGSFSNQEDNY
jgi:hypothetical protein